MNFNHFYKKDKLLIKSTAPLEEEGYIEITEAEYNVLHAAKIQERETRRQLRELQKQQNEN